MNTEELRHRLEALEAVEEIKKLKARYCQCADERDPEGFANLFADDGVFDGGAFGRGSGRMEIAKFLRDAQQKFLPFALHFVMNPIVEVHGSTATGRWYLLEPCTMVTDGTQAQAVWGAARYDDEYIRVNGQWKFQRVHLMPVFWTAYDQGWEKKRFVQE